MAATVSILVHEYHSVQSNGAEFKSLSIPENSRLNGLTCITISKDIDITGDDGSIYKEATINWPCMGEASVKDAGDLSRLMSMAVAMAHQFDKDFPPGTRVRPKEPRTVRNRIELQEEVGGLQWKKSSMS